MHTLVIFHSSIYPSIISSFMRKSSSLEHSREAHWKGLPAAIEQVLEGGSLERASWRIQLASTIRRRHAAGCTACGMHHWSIPARVSGTQHHLLLFLCSAPKHVEEPPIFHQKCDASEVCRTCRSSNAWYMLIEQRNLSKFCYKALEFTYDEVDISVYTRNNMGFLFIKYAMYMSIKYAVVQCVYIHVHTYFSLSLSLYIYMFLLGSSICATQQVATLSLNWLVILLVDALQYQPTCSNTSSRRSRALQACWKQGLLLAQPPVHHCRKASQMLSSSRSRSCEM